MSDPDFFPIVINEKSALLDMCWRNVLRYAVGEISLTPDLQKQLKFTYDNSNKLSRELLQSIFDFKLFLEGDTE